MTHSLALVHGKNRYKKKGCRCDVCSAAHAAWVKGQRAKRVPPPPGDPRHGQRTIYVNWNCRCDLCKAGHAKYTREHR